MSFFKITPIMKPIDNMSNSTMTKAQPKEKVSPTRKVVGNINRSLIVLQDMYERSDIDPDEVTGKNPFEDFASSTPGALGSVSEQVLAKTKFLKNHL